MDNPTTEQRDELIAQFCGVASGVSHIQAQELLAANGWDIELALASHFGGADEDVGESGAGEPADYTGPRTLDGRPAPESSVPSTSRPSRSTGGRAQGGMRTLRDIQSGNSSSQAHDDDDSDDENQDLYAGGEKSGLSVQNPGAPRDPQAAIREMMRRAGQNVPRPGGEDTEQHHSHFTGTAHTLGGDDVPSQTISDPNPRQPRPAPPQQRELHIWRNGFSVDDGPLYRYDDPANARWLEMINRGQAPLEIMNVQRGQEVDVHLHPHRDEDYIQPKKKYKPFSGQGQRLGSPTPGASSSEGQFAAPPSSTAPASNVSAGSSNATMDVDTSQPTLTLQIRLGDGTRLRSQFNTTHTIGDVYGFVDRASSASTQRSYVLMTTFPSKELSDRGLVLGDMAELKKGGVVVQKWA